MGTVIGWFLIVLGSITLIVIILILLAILSYRRLTFTYKPVSAFPEFKFKLASVIASVVSFIARNFISAASGFVGGVKLNGQVTCHNHSFMPLYFPPIEHEVSINGKPSLNPISTQALWLKPGDSVTLPVTLSIGTHDIPLIALDGLTHSGALDIEIKSRVTVGSLSVLKITRVTTGKPRALQNSSKASKKLALKAGKPVVVHE